MSTMNLAAWLALSLVVLAGSEPASPNAKTTLGDLQIAYNLERNAEQSYLTCARQADRSGLHKAACLLRAVARGERIHAASHAVEIQRLGGTPTATIEEIAPRTLQASLRAAIAEERYERDHMYLLFARTAHNAGVEAAASSFERAREAETTHAALLQEALDGLRHMKIAQTFYVCPKCGSLTTEIAGDQCVGCGAPMETAAAVE